MTRSNRESETRNTQSREATEVPATYEVPTNLELPDLGPDLHLRWIRISTGGKDDARSLQARMREGYRFVMKDEVPDFKVGSHQGSKFDGVVGFNDVALVAIPKAKMEARMRHYQGQTAQKTRAIDTDLFKERHPSMPLTNDSGERAERVTRGRAPSFDTDAGTTP
jgi:hypothetical protein